MLYFKSILWGKCQKILKPDSSIEGHGKVLLLLCTYTRLLSAQSGSLPRSCSGALTWNGFIVGRIVNHLAPV